MRVCLVLATFVGTFLLSDASLPGTCASIGHHNSCCRVTSTQNCQATDGGCLCSQDCHNFGECCQDVNCPRDPTTCAEVGITECCSDPRGASHCDVFNSTGRVCSCHLSCHLRSDCCPDAAMFCVPTTCAEAGKDPGCCRTGLFAQSCYVGGGRCYCDSQCVIFNDCCDDVPRACASMLMENTKLLSTMQKELVVARKQDYVGDRYRHYRRDTMEMNRPLYRDIKKEGD